MQSAILRSAVPADRVGILKLNEAAVPNVNSIPLSALESLHENCFSLTLTEVGGALAGFLLALAPEAAYDSLNFRWFCERYDNFTYVDRVVVDSRYHRRGIGKALYADLEQHCSGIDSLTCEVNLRPPNPGSLAFHHHIGFQEVGRQDLDGGSRRVSLMFKDLS